jgi:hypothetical protein
LLGQGIRLAYPRAVAPCLAAHRPPQPLAFSLNRYE